MDQALALAMQRAVALASNGPEYGANPRVGSVIVSANGTVLGEGFHHGAGTPHAEVEALADAAARGNDVRGAIAVVTLEPCSHTGRTGPCTDALTDAGIGSVYYAVPDPNPAAAGGGEVLKQRGIAARHLPSPEALDLNYRWLRSVQLGRPYVIAKWASTLDGRTAALDGTSFWITGEPARDHAHQTRASVDAIVVGTGTVLIDNPRLTARPGGTDSAHQPLRVVMGMRNTRESKVWKGGDTIAVETHDPSELLAALGSKDVRSVLVEGGSAVTTAFVAAGLVDEVHAYIAPVILGAGTASVGDVGISTMQDALRSERVKITPLGADTLVTAFFSRGL